MDINNKRETCITKTLQFKYDDYYPTIVDNDQSDQRGKVWQQDSQKSKRILFLPFSSQNKMKEQTRCGDNEKKM